MKKGIGKKLVFMVIIGSLTLLLACGGGASQAPESAATATPAPPTATPAQPTPTPLPPTPTTTAPTPVPPTVRIAAANTGENEPLKIISNKTIPLALNVTGEIVTFNWRLDGLGHLEKDGSIPSLEGQTNRYTAPRVTGTETLHEIIIVTVTDKHSNSAEDRIFIEVMAPAEQVQQATPGPDTPIGPPPSPTPPVLAQETPTPTVPPPTPIPPPTATPLPLPCIVRITDPQNNARVFMSAAVQGTVTPACEGGDSLWLMVEILGRQWPQELLSPFPTGGQELSWFANANIGVEGDAGKAFGLKVIRANDRIDQEFTDWFLRGQQTGNWPGFVPQNLTNMGARTVAGVTVVRN
ncbi:MAG: hypothetical protein ACE5Q6_00925 [Dehalococcoidia bacterium]